jgi:uncharacterized membrane protein
LGTLSGLDSSEAYSINNHGQTVGIAYKSESQNYFETRTVYFHPTDPNNNTDLGALPGYDSATPFFINDCGKIVGRVHHSDHLYFTPRAVLFDPTGSENNIDLGSIPGSECAEAFSINNYDQIVGRAPIGENMSDCAVMFDPTGQGSNINLNDRVESGDDLYLNAALAINDHGWITGIATDPNGKRVAFLLVPLAASKADFEPDGDVDLEDFGVLANAWRSTPVDDYWNPLCDISEPNDGVIDELDLKVFTENWLAGF